MSRPTQTVGPLSSGMSGRKHLRPGDLVDGRYEILARLGTGGYGVVYRVRDRHLKRDVALKVLRPDRLSESARIRLRREVQVARDVACPQLVRVYDIGEDGELTWVTMELVEGETLRDRLRRGRLEIDEAIRVAKEILSGLAGLHERGIVHRDVKPGNVLLAADGAVKLGDFGLALHWDRDETRATDTSSLVGTAEYVSPEQALGEEVGPRSDLYGLGVVFFEMLTGRLPHEASSSLGTILAHIRKPAEDVRRLRPEVPFWLAAVVARLLEKRSKDRFANASTVLEMMAWRRVSWCGRFGFLVRRASFRRAAAATITVVGLFLIFLLITRGLFRVSELSLILGSGTLRAVEGRREVWEKKIIGSWAEKVEVLPGQVPRVFTFLDMANPEDRYTLRMLDLQSGAEVLTYSMPEGPVYMREWGFSDDFFPKAAAVDVDRDGVAEFVLDYFHQNQWPSYSIIFSPRYQWSRLVLVASGHMDFVDAVDVDGDGERDLIYLGPNNRMGWLYSLSVVKVSYILQKRDAGLRGYAYAVTPGDFYGVVHTNDSLVWSCLLPVYVCSWPECVRIDEEARVFHVKTVEGGEVVVGFDGFLWDSEAVRIPGREMLRRQAYEGDSRVRRLRSHGSFNEALEEVGRAIALADRVSDKALEEWLSRVQAEILVELGRVDEAERKFLGLYRRSQSPSDVAFEAANAFHLDGRLEHAVRWYERGLGKARKEFEGRNAMEFILGAVVALVEVKSIEAAEGFLARLSGRHADVVEACRAYLNWRRGRQVGLTSSSIYKGPGLNSYDVFEYWFLEERYVGGEEARRLRPDAERVYRLVSEESRALVKALIGELRFEMGERQEGLSDVEEALRQLQVDMRRFPVARAHYDWVVARYERLAEELGDDDVLENAASLVEKHKRWREEQEKRYHWTPQAIEPAREGAPGGI